MVVFRSDDNAVFASRAIFSVVLIALFISAVFQWNSGCRGTSLLLLGIVVLLTGFQSTGVFGIRALQLFSLLGTGLLLAGGYLFLVARVC